MTQSLSANPRVGEHMSGPMLGKATVSCVSCGLVPPDDWPPPSWSVSLEREQRVWACERCVRANIRNIESQLEPLWW